MQTFKWWQIDGDLSLNLNLIMAVMCIQYGIAEMADILDIVRIIYLLIT